MTTKPTPPPGTKIRFGQCYFYSMGARDRKGWLRVSDVAGGPETCSLEHWETEQEGKENE